MIYGLLIVDGLRCLALSCAALLALAILRRASASTRHVVAVSALVAMLLAPWIGARLPQRTIDPPTAISTPIAFVAAPMTAADTITSAAAPHTQHEARSAANLIPGIISILWLCGALALLLRLTLGYLRLSVWKRGAKPYMNDRILITPHAKVPMTTWLGRPVIFLPVGSGNWDQDRLDRVIQHEEAHIQRSDWLWHVMGQMACALYWPLPTVWVLQRIAKANAENACDDMILNRGIQPADYAQDLLTIARDLAGAWPPTALPMIGKSELGHRIAHILSRKVRRTSAGFATLGITALAASATALSIFVTGFYTVPDGAQVGPSASGWGTPGTWSGTPLNHYIGTTSDGRKIELLQITHLGAHGFEAWKPDGTIIPNANAYGAKKTWWLSGPTRLEIVYRFPTKATEDLLTASQGSGPGVPKQALPQMFSGGRLLPLDGTRKRTLACYVDLLNARGKTSNYTFSLSDKPWELAGTIELRPDRTADVKSLSLANLSFAPSERVVGHDFDRYGHLKDVPPHILVNNRVVTKEMNAPRVSFRIPHRFYTDVRVEAVDKEGRRHDELHVSGPITLEDTSETHWSSVPLADLKAIRIYTRKMENVEFLSVRVRPNRP